MLVHVDAHVHVRVCTMLVHVDAHAHVHVRTIALNKLFLLIPQQMTMMFEVQDLAVASPATVSRCGMVYLEPSILGLSPFVRCWLRKLPEAIMPHKEKLELLFHKFMEPSIKFLRKNLKEIVPTNNGNLTFSLVKIMDCFFVPFLPKEVR